MKKLNLCFLEHQMDGHSDENETFDVEKFLLGKCHRLGKFFFPRKYHRHGSSFPVTPASVRKKLIKMIKVNLESTPQDQTLPNTYIAESVGVGLPPFFSRVMAKACAFSTWTDIN